MDLYLGTTSTDNEYFATADLCLVLQINQSTNLPSKLSSQQPMGQIQLTRRTKETTATIFQQLLLLLLFPLVWICCGSQQQDLFLRHPTTHFPQHDLIEIASEV